MKKLLALCLMFMLLTGIAAAPAWAEETVAASSVITVDTESDALVNNIDIASGALDGVMVAAGETFSFNNLVGPRTEENGYQEALNGQGAEVVGGGVSEVATVLYLALQELDGIDYVQKGTYGDNFTGDYVFSGEDAIMTDYDQEIDFSFQNNFETFRISIWRDDTDLNCQIVTGMEYTPETGSEDSGDESFGDESSAAGQSSFAVSGNDALTNNISQACNAIDGLTLESGDTFSFNDIVGSRTEDNGYETAVNGRGVKVVGGGVAQVASAIWLAVKYLDDVSIVEKSTYGSKYNQDYVGSASDAILVDYDAGTDFSFRYTGDGTLEIYTHLNGDTLVCEVYQQGGNSGSWPLTTTGKSGE
jgi:vancomycin resistance protein YoaR